MWAYILLPMRLHDNYVTGKSRSQRQVNRGVKLLMAKKKRAGKSKSQHIRDYLAANPGATPNQIKDGLAKQGVKVSTGLASNVKYTSGTGAKKKKKPGRRGRPKATPLSAQNLLDAKKLADDLGGIGEARKALDALEKLQ